jgi:thymidylate kinase
MCDRNADSTLAYQATATALTWILLRQMLILPPSAVADLTIC